MYDHVAHVVAEPLGLLQSFVIFLQLVEESVLTIPATLFFQRGADPRVQQSRVERLGQVIFRARLDAPHHGLHFAHDGDHDDRQMPKLIIRPDAVQHFIAVHIRHHHIEEHEVEVFLAHQPQGILPAACRPDVMALLRQTAGEHIAVDRIVINNQQNPWSNGRLLLGGRSGRVLRFVKIVDRGGERLVIEGCEVFFDEREHPMTCGADVFEVGHEALAAFRFLSLGEHFRVPDDLIERIPQIVQKLRRHSRSGRTDDSIRLRTHEPAHEILRIGTLAACGRDGAPSSSVTIFARRRVSSIGLVS